MYAKTRTMLFLAALAVFGLWSVAAEAQEQTQKTYYGQTSALGQSAVRTYVTVDKNQAPVALGLEFPATALRNLPAETSNIILEFPSQAGKTPFKYIMFDWNPQGHEPDRVYTLPHFDIHFYIQDLAEVNRIDPGPCNGLACDDFGRAMLPVPPQLMPQGYVNVGAAVPRMGNHLIDPSAPEFNGQPFTRTFLYGVYEGKLTFYEPMISLAHLQSRPDETINLKVPSAVASSGYYPTKYSIKYNAETEVYTIALEGFVQRSGMETASKK